jgi:hypothetical protein
MRHFARATLVTTFAGLVEFMLRLRGAVVLTLEVNNRNNRPARQAVLIFIKLSVQYAPNVPAKR